MRDYFLLFSIITSCLLLLACDKSGEVQDSESARVGDERLINADAEPHNWLNHGRTYTEQRFSPLEQINAEYVAQLKLAWHLDLPSRRGLEATPLVVDGRMYTTGTWSRVYVLDGRLIALDAMSGREVWSVQTTPSDRRYTITGAPRIVNGRVLIGNGGAEFDARGFVTAYDAATGEQVWRFYTVPGDAGISAGVIPDLRYMDTATHDLWDAIVLGGARLAKGMPGFSEHLEKAETDAIHAYVIKRAHDLEYIPVRKSSVLTD